MTDRTQELELWQKYHAGDKTVLYPLLQSMTPLLKHQANKFRASGLPTEAIDTQAKVLAVKAFDTFDPDRGTQLNTHVVNHMKHLQRFVLNYQNIGKIPEHRGLAISKFQHVVQNLAEDLGRDPSLAEISDTIHWPIQEVERMQSEMRKDLAMVEEEGSDAGGFFSFVPADDRQQEITDAVQYIYYSASPEDQKILEYTFGFGGSPKKNKKEIAQLLNKSDAYVRKRQRLLSKEINSIMELKYGLQ